MTGYTVHTGSNEKFTAGWDAIFAKAGAKKSAAKGKAKSGRANAAGKKSKKKR
jgi:hypothetical protein